MRTLFSSDFDNTLRFGARGIGEADLAAIAAFRARGGVFGINTGRSVGSLDGSLRGAFEPDFIISVSGAYILGPGRKLLYEHPLPRDLAARLLARYRWPSMGLCIGVSDESWTVAPLSWFPFLARRVSTRGALTLRQLPEKVYGLSVRFFRLRDASRVAQDMRRRFGNEVSVYQNLTSLDVVAAGCSKGEGLRIVKREFGAGLAAAMGDSYNDLPQLEAADRSYTFAHAPEQVRQAADVLEPSVAAALADLEGHLA